MIGLTSTGNTPAKKAHYKSISTRTRHIPCSAVIVSQDRHARANPWTMTFAKLRTAYVLEPAQKLKKTPPAF